MKKLFLAIFMVLLVGCSQADRVSYNLSKDADNFNAVRQLTVINGIKGEILFQMTGKISIHEKTSPRQLEIIVEESEGVYKKHFVGLSDNVTYLVEDITGRTTNPNQYQLNFNPNMIIPFELQVVE